MEVILEMFGVKKSTFYDWQNLPAVALEKKPIISTASVRPEEVAALLAYRELNPDIGCRKFTWQMVDANIAFLSESKVYDILSEHNRLQGWNRVDNGATEKEYRHKPKHVHYHWHTDIAYIKVGGIFYFLIMMLDGYSRYLLDWELMTDMLGGSVENFVQRVKEKYPHAKPRLIILPESLKTENRRKLQLKKLNPLTTITHTLKIPAMTIFVLTYGLLFLAGNVHPSVWTLYTEHKFGWNSIQVGISLSFVGLIYGLSQSLLTKKLVPLWGENKSVVIGILFNALGFFLYGFAPAGWMMYAIMLVSALQGLSMPCLQSLMTKKVEASHQGELQGGLVSISSLTAILAPLIYTRSFNWGVSQQNSIFLGAPYFVAASISVAALVLVYRTLRVECSAST